MDRPRLIRGLRVAVSAVFGILCVLLIVLWVRSYWWLDDVAGPVATNWTLYIATGPGTGSVIIRNASRANWQLDGTLTDEAYENQEQGSVPWPRLWGRLYFESNSVGGVPYWSIGLPFWLLILLSVVMAYVPWIPLRRSFSLRTLLIATTLIAVLLATAAYSRLW